MDERKLLAAAAILIAALLIGVLAVSGDRQQPTPPGHVGVTALDIQPAGVGGDTATLQTTTRLRHRGGTTRNVTVEVRAVDSATGLLETEVEKSVGTLSDDREYTVTHNVSVAREGGYVVEAIVYVDDSRESSTSKRVEGVGTLTPDYARSSVGFHRFVNLPSIEYSVERASGGSVAIDVSAYLTNQGSSPSGDLTLTLKARQSDSNIVASESRIQVGAINPGETATPSTTLVVPDNYNYYLDAVLWRGDTVVGEARSIAHLDPTENVSRNVTRRSVGLEVSDFEATDRERELERLREQLSQNQTGAEAPGQGQPGFVALAAVAALLTVIALHRRKQ